MSSKHLGLIVPAMFAVCFCRSGAALSEQPPMAKDIGQQSCQQFLNKPISSPARDGVYVQWVAGFLIGKTEGIPKKTSDKLELELVAILLTTWCMDNQNQSVLAAARAINSGYRIKKLKDFEFRD